MSAAAVAVLKRPQPPRSCQRVSPRWNDPANANGWSASATILTPSLLPLGFVATGLVGNSFTMSIPGANAPAIDVSSTSLAALTGGLTAGEPVKVYGVPQADGSLKAYVMAYYTGDLPAQ
jgi:hypothetical protein